ncbi:unnamed protein product [Effrenium voratum]|nr:unnamed protein product [Effrenium voratum]
MKGWARAGAIALLKSARKRGAAEPLAVACARLLPDLSDALDLPPAKRPKVDLTSPIFTVGTSGTSGGGGKADQVRLRQILLRTAGTGPPVMDPIRRRQVKRTQEEAESEMFDILQSLEADGFKNFQKVCRNVSECPSALKGGDLVGDMGWLDRVKGVGIQQDKAKQGVRPQVPAAVQKAAFQLAVGEVHDLVTTDAVALTELDLSLPAEAAGLVQPPAARRPWELAALAPEPTEELLLCEDDSEVPAIESQAAKDESESVQNEDAPLCNEGSTPGPLPAPCKERGAGKAKAKSVRAKAKGKAKPKASRKEEAMVAVPSMRPDAIPTAAARLGSQNDARLLRSREAIFPDALIPRRGDSTDVLYGIEDEMWDGEVKLQVYHLAKAVKVVGLPIYHTGVEVYGMEHYFCLEGVETCWPQGYGQGVHKLAVPLGKTKLSSSRVDQVIRKMKPKWPGKEYKLLSHNCQSFAVELVSVLLPNVSVPSEYCRFAGPKPKPAPKQTLLSSRMY